MIPLAGIGGLSGGGTTVSPSSSTGAVDASGRNFNLISTGGSMLFLVLGVAAIFTVILFLKRR